MSKLSVVIPVWNEEEAIAQVVERVLSVAGALRQRARITELEVLVVDDGSTDGTARVVRQLALREARGKKQVRLLQHGANRGYGAALQTGFKAATGNLLAFLDADCTYPPEHLPDLCSALTPDTALVVGDRLHGPSSAMPALRRLGNRFFAALVSLLTQRPALDCCSGMRVMPASTWRALGRLPDGLDFTPAMTVRALLAGLNVAQVAIPYHQRLGRSKLKVLRDGVRFLRSILREAQACEPGRLWAALGMLAALPALSLGAGVAALEAAPHSPWAAWGLGALAGAPWFLAGWSLAVGAARQGLAPRAAGRRAVEQERVT